jgi:hypothetical protein
MDRQRSFFDKPTGTIVERVSMPHAPHSPTSKAAAVQAEPRAGTDERRVLDYVAGQGSQGATRHEIAAGLHLQLATVCARVCALVQRGYLFETGETRLTESKRKAAVLRLRKDRFATEDSEHAK